MGRVTCHTRRTVMFAVTGVAIIMLFMASLILGPADIPASAVVRILAGDGSYNEGWRYIVAGYRLPQALTAMLCGGSLAVCGLMLQSILRNPLADPSLLGISSGAGLGVAVVMLWHGGSIVLGGMVSTGIVAVMTASFAGAMAVTCLMYVLSTLIRSTASLLIAGVMVGYLSSSAIVLLNYFASSDGIRAYLLWGMGNFSGISMDMMPYFALPVIICLIASALLVKPLSLVVLGDAYASNLGVNTTLLRNSVLVVTGALASIATSFCGPVSFIGLAVPHVARIILKTDSFSLLLPSVFLAGSAIALLCNVVSVGHGGGEIIPLNALTPIFGAPVIMYILLKKRQ